MRRWTAGVARSLRGGVAWGPASAWARQKLGLRLLGPAHTEYTGIDSPVVPLLSRALIPQNGSVDRVRFFLALYSQPWFIYVVLYSFFPGAGLAGEPTVEPHTLGGHQTCLARVSDFRLTRHAYPAESRRRSAKGPSYSPVPPPAASDSPVFPPYSSLSLSYVI